MKRNGLLAAGSWIVDQVKMVDVFPQRETLANIMSQSEGTGGSPYNILINLAKLGAKFPMSAAGLVGDDALGQYILDDLKRHQIDASPDAIRAACKCFPRATAIADVCWHFRDVE